MYEALTRGSVPWRFLQTGFVLEHVRVLAFVRSFKVLLVYMKRLV